MFNLPRKPSYERIELQSDFFQLFRKIESSFSNCFLLESLSDESYDSRYSVIGFDPPALIEAARDSLLIHRENRSELIRCENPYYELRNLMPSDILARNYAGGLVGYLGYDSMNLFEPTLSLRSHPGFPVFLFGFYTDGLVHDKFTGESFYFHYGNSRSGEILELDRQSAPDLAVPEIKHLSYTKSREEHAAMIDETKKEIIAGNTFQCQIGFSAEYSFKGSAIPFYENLREINPSPHMFYLKFSDKALVGASPELIFRLRNAEMESYPLAGTIHRGSTPAEDRTLRRQLLNDPKEIAEHNMLIDLHRNDIGRVARFGTVKVRRIFDIKRFSHVQHISSEVVGIIRPEEDMFSGLASSFPAGTLSGAPKIESMKIINRIENEPRGPYGGAVGHFGLNGDCTFAIPIRTLFKSGEKAFSRASGGIVYDSVAANEYREIKNKLAAIEKTVKMTIDKSKQTGGPA